MSERATVVVLGRDFDPSKFEAVLEGLEAKRPSFAERGAAGAKMIADSVTGDEAAEWKRRALAAEGEVAEMLRSYVMLSPGDVAEIARSISGASEREATDWICRKHRGGFVGVALGDAVPVNDGLGSRYHVVGVAVDLTGDDPRGLLTCADVLGARYRGAASADVARGCCHRCDATARRDAAAR